MGLIIEPYREPLVRRVTGFGFSPGGRATKKRVPVASGAAPPFDPATLPLSLWTRGSYGGAPWDSLPSAGASDTNPLIAGVAAAVGGAVNGFTPADFNGTSHYLVGTDTTATMIGGTAWTLFALVNFDTLAVDSGVSANPPVYSDDQALVGVEFSDAQSRIWQFNAASSPFNATTSALVAGTWTMVNARWTGSNIQIGLNAAWGATTAIASLAAATGAAWFGRNFNTAYADAKFMEIMVAASSLSDTDTTNVKGYWNSRYALSL